MTTVLLCLPLPSDEYALVLPVQQERRMVDKIVNQPQLDEHSRCSVAMALLMARNSDPMAGRCALTGAGRGYEWGSLACAQIRAPHIESDSVQEVLR